MHSVYCIRYGVIQPYSRRSLNYARAGRRLVGSRSVNATRILAATAVALPPRKCYE